MGALGYRFRASWRGRSRSWLTRGVLFGIAAAVVLATLLTAQRTESAADRFDATHHAFDVYIPNDRHPGIARFDPAEVAALPNVIDTAVAGVVYLYIGSGEVALATEDDRIGTEVNAFEIVDGRRADPDRPEEAVIGMAVADRYDLQVGDTIPLFDPTAVAPPPVPPSLEQAVARVREVLPDLRITVVGIEASPNELPPQPAGSIRANGSIHLTPALDEVAITSGRAIEVRLRHGAGDVPAFLDDLRELGGGKALNVSTGRELSAETDRSLHVQAQALRLLSAMAVMAALVILGPLVSRATLAEGGDLGVLAALGSTRRGRAAMAVAPSLVVGLTAAPIAAGGALALTALGPFGLARTIEPDPGVWFDTRMVLLGALAVALVVPMLALPAAARSARRGLRGIGIRRNEVGAPRVSRVAAAAATLGAAPPVALGGRLALETAGDDDAVPVRSTLLAVTMSVLVATAAVTFGASLHHLLQDERSYGVVWTAYLTNFGDGPVLARHAAVLRDDPDVEAYATGRLDIPATIGAQRTSLFALDAGKGDALPPIVAGRLPAGPDEMAIGTRTGRELHVGVDDTVQVALEGHAPTTLRVVGVAVLASPGTGHLGEGGLVHLDSDVFRGTDGDSFVGQDVMVRLRPGASFDAVAQKFDQFAPATVGFDVPADIENIGQVDHFPPAIAALLSAVALASLGNTLVSAIRRRRRDFALLKTFGFVGRQVRTTVLVQATTLVVIGLAGGVPLGIVLGRWTWQLLARQIGVVPVPVTPGPILVLLVPAALLLGALVALLPARTAARTPVASSLKET